jgi:hypothetical protein
MNAHISPRKVPIILARFFKNPQLSNFMSIISSVRNNLFHTVRHDKANSYFTQFCEYT